MKNASEGEWNHMPKFTTRQFIPHTIQHNNLLMFWRRGSVISLSFGVWRRTNSSISLQKRSIITIFWLVSGVFFLDNLICISKSTIIRFQAQKSTTLKREVVCSFSTLMERVRFVGSLFHDLHDPAQCETEPAVTLIKLVVSYDSEWSREIKSDS